MSLTQTQGSKTWAAFLLGFQAPAAWFSAGFFVFRWDFGLPQLVYICRAQAGSQWTSLSLSLSLSIHPHLLPHPHPPTFPHHLLPPYLSTCPSLRAVGGINIPCGVCLRGFTAPLHWGPLLHFTGGDPPTSKPHSSQSTLPLSLGAAGVVPNARPCRGSLWPEGS